MIVSDIFTKIAPTPLQMAWSWDPFELPSTMLTNAQHLDHMLYETRKFIYGLDKNFTDTKTSQKQFDDMIIQTKFQFSYFPILIWVSLGISSTIIFVLFCIAVYRFFFRKPPTTPETHVQQQPLQDNLQPLVNNLPAILHSLANQNQTHAVNMNHLNPRYSR